MTKRFNVLEYDKASIKTVSVTGENLMSLELRVKVDLGFRVNSWVTIRFPGNVLNYAKCLLMVKDFLPFVTCLVSLELIGNQLCRGDLMAGKDSLVKRLRDKKVLTEK